MEDLRKTFPFLKRMPKKQRCQFEAYFSDAPEWLLNESQIVEMEKNTILVEENAPADTIYFIGRGSVKAVDYRRCGIAYDFTRFDDVYALGGLEVLTGDEKYRTTLQTMTNCTVVKIPRVIFEKWLNSDVRVMRLEARNVATYLLEQGRNSRACLFLQGPDRLAYILLDMYERYQKDGVLFVKKKRSELSDLSGLCTRTIDRAINKFEENGWITRQGIPFTMNKEQYRQCNDYISALIER